MSACANNIQLGESHIRAFKSAFEGLPQDKTSRQLKDLLQNIGEQLVRFANADGGDLLIGVEDDGSLYSSLSKSAQCSTGISCVVRLMRAQRWYHPENVRELVRRCVSAQERS